MPQAFLSPEEEELERKLAELATVESELFMAEAGLESLRSELRDFEEAYMKAVGPCYAAMEELQAEAMNLPKDGEFASSCSTAAHQAEFCSPGELKSLFREVAKHIHPDLAISEEDRRKRDEFMAGANAAYANGNDAHLRDLLMQFKGDPEAIKGEDIGSRLIRAIRSIARAKNKIDEARIETLTIRKTDLYFLKQRADRASFEGRDFLAETTAKLERQLEQERARVAQMAAQ